MSIFSGRSGLALALAAALCLGGRIAHAQVSPVGYWIPSWPFGFSGNPTVGLGTYGNFPSFDGGDIRGGGFSYMRYNFPNGWFVGSEGGGMGLSMNGISQVGAFGNTSLYYQGAQFGYNFQNAPLTVYAGFDTLKYNTGLGNPFAPFDSVSGTLPGYSVHAGVEFKPTSNLSLSLGVGFTQQSGNINSFSPGSSPFAFGSSR
jgi:opacity protein-like surface antigen